MQFFKKSLFVAFLSYVLVMSALAQTASLPTPPTTIPYDCTDIDLAKVDDLLLTKEERIAKMDGSLQTSLDAYSECIKSAQQAMSASSGSSGGASGGGANGTEDKSGEGSAQDGTEQQDAQQNKEKQEQEASPRSIGGRNTRVQRENVDPKDNDSIICQLLWEEIQTATDDKRKGFEQQYKEYKCKRSL
jgi:hypothetical protein